MLEVRGQHLCCLLSAYPDCKINGKSNWEAITGDDKTNECSADFKYCVCLRNSVYFFVLRCFTMNTLTLCDHQSGQTLDMSLYQSSSIL